MTLEDFVSGLKNPKPHKYKGQPGYAACCPAHPDKNASFFVWEGSDGWLHVKCQTGCAETDIERAMGIEAHDRCIETRAPVSVRNNIIYSYYDIEGIEAFCKVRFITSKGIKSFVQYVRFDAEGKPLPKIKPEPTAHRPDPEERYMTPGEANIGARAKILYRLSEVLSASTKGNIVYVCEGEKAVEAFRIRGHVATCQPAGAGPGKWLKEHSECLKGATVVIVADRDKPGEEYAKEVAASLVGYARSIRVVQSKTENEKDDAYDHLEAGHSVDEFIRRSELEPPRNLSVRRNAAMIQPKEVSWISYPYIASSTFMLLEADPGIGKSFISSALAAALSIGSSLPFGDGPFPVGRSLMYMTEDSAENTTVPRLASFGADLSKIDIIDEVMPLDRNGLDRLRNDIIESEAIFCVLDPITAFIDAVTKSPRPSLDTHAIVGGIRLIAEETGCTIFGIRHLRKSSSQDTNAIYSGIGDISIVGKARIALQVRRDTEYNEPRVKRAIITTAKNNLGPFGKAIVYDICEGETPRGMGQLLWVGQRDYDPALDAAKRNNSRGDQSVAKCEEWIRSKLQVPGGTCASLVLCEWATKAGFSLPTFRRASSNITKALKQGGEWYRVLIDDDPFAGEE